jgi:hypothetical protein
MATDEAYEAAAEAVARRRNPWATRKDVIVDGGEYDECHNLARAAVDAVWDLAIAEGQRQAAEDLVAETVAGLNAVQSRTKPWAARIAAGETP